MNTDNISDVLGLFCSCPCLLRSAHTRGVVPTTSPLKSLHEGTGCRDLSHEQFTRSVLTTKSQGLVPKIQTSLNLWDQSQGPNFGPCD